MYGKMNEYLESSVLSISNGASFLIGRHIKNGDVLKMLLILDAPENPGDHFCVPTRRDSIRQFMIF